jgi:hypothetical protein
MVGDPIYGMVRDRLQSPWFLKEVRRFRHNAKLVFAAHLCLGLSVHIEDCRVVLSDDEKTRSLETSESLSGHIGAPAPGDYRVHSGTGLRRGLYRRRGAGAGAEKMYLGDRYRLLRRDPLESVVGSLGKKGDVEATFPVRIFCLGKKVEEKAPDARVLELFGNKVVPNAVHARPAPVDKYHELVRVRGNSHVAFEGDFSRWYLNHALLLMIGYPSGGLWSMIRLE